MTAGSYPSGLATVGVGRRSVTEDIGPLLFGAFARGRGMTIVSEMVPDSPREQFGEAGSCRARAYRFVSRRPPIPPNIPGLDKWMPFH